MQKLISILWRKTPEKHVLYGLIAIISLVPLYFGGDRPIPIALTSIFVGCLCAYWGVCAAKDSSMIRVSLKKCKWLALVTLMVFLWASVQALPFDIPGFSNELWNPARQLLPDVHIKSSISIAPHESWLELFKMLTYAAIFWLALQISRTGNNAIKILQAISWSGAGYAIYGLLVQALGIKKIFWYDKVSYADSLTSTFINRNNYATYAGVALVVSVALLFNSLFKDTGRIKGSEFYKIIIKRMFTTSLPFLFISSVVAAALVGSGSRAGIGCSALGLLSLICVSNFNNEIKNHRKVFAGLSVAVAAMFIIVFGVGGNLAAARFGNIDSDASLRGVIYKITLNIISDFPFIGTGLGSFADIFKVYSDSQVAVFGGTLTDHAHNSYLELAVELGIPAAALLVFVMAAIWLKCLQGALLRKRDGHIPASAACATIVVATHALFDFSAQVPAVAVILTVLLAVGFSQGWPSKVDLSYMGEEENILPGYYKISTKLPVAIGITLLFAGFWQGVIYFTGNGDHYKFRNMAYEEIEGARVAGVITPNGEGLLGRAEKDLVQAIKLTPSDSYSLAYLSYTKLLSGDDMAKVASLLAASISTGCCEPGLVFFRLGMIPVIWGYASDEEKAILTNQIVLAKKLDAVKAQKIIATFQEY